MESHEIGIRLRMLNNAVRRYLDKNAGMYELDHFTCSNAWIIAHICRSGGCVFQRDLENEFGITRSTASKVIILLEKKGLIKREGVSHDARLKKITLTEKSIDIAKALHENSKEMEAQLVKGFSPQELEVLYGYLDRIQANLDEAENNQPLHINQRS